MTFRPLPFPFLPPPTLEKPEAAAWAGKDEEKSKGKKYEEVKPNPFSTAALCSGWRMRNWSSESTELNP